MNIVSGDNIDNVKSQLLKNKEEFNYDMTYLFSYMLTSIAIAGIIAWIILKITKKDMKRNYLLIFSIMFLVSTIALCNRYFRL